MAAVLNKLSGGLGRIEQYEDDSLDAWFTDGTKISLTPCGSVFTRLEKTNRDRDVPLQSVHRFTCYAGREWRDKVRQLLAFRNSFAERPFLPLSLLRQELQVLNNVIQYAVWPSTLQQATINNLLRTGSTGNTRLSTTNGCAYAELAGHGEILTVAYLARVAQDRVDNCLTVEEREMVEDGVARLGLSEDGKKKENAEVFHQYIWREVIHSTANIPALWQHPLSLLQQHRAHDSHMISHSQEKENDRADAVISTPLPHTLTLTCHNAHLHHCQNKAQHLRIKVLLTEGIIYRVFPDHSKPYVEVLANQNTLLRSHDPQGRFFDCWIRNEGSGGCVQRSMYCIDHTPSSVGLSFSMARVMGMASRLLGQTLKLARPQSRFCWKAPSPLPSPSSCPRQYTVPGLGCFTLRGNGHVRCVFVDRTIIDYYYHQSHTPPSAILPSHNTITDTTSLSLEEREFGGGLDRSSQGVKVARGPQGVEVDGGTQGVKVAKRPRGVEVARGVWIGEHLCRVLQPNGRYMMISTQHPTSHHRYIEVIKEWCAWVAQPETERGQFYQRTIYDEKMQREVLAELSKIERFNTILTAQQQQPLSDIKCISGCGQSTDGCGQQTVPSFVQDALRKTETIVQDIDTILQK